MDGMNLVLKRFLFISEDRTTNPFIPFFITLNLLAGIVILAIHFSPLLPELILFSIFEKLLGVKFAGLLWGGGMILSSILHVLEMYFRNGRFGSLAAWISLLLWSYIMGAYGAELFWFASVLVTPLVFFWGWYLVKWRRYTRMLREGTFPQVS